MERGLIEDLLAEGLSVEAIGRELGKAPSTVSYWMKKYGIAAPNREKYASKGGVSRDALEELVGRGLTVREIAETLGLGFSTVRHWLGKYDLQTPRARRLRQGNAARKAGVQIAEMVCQKHGLTRYVVERSGRTRCMQCRSEAVADHRRKLKETLVQDAGGKCGICGYDRFLGALHFHHLDPSEKSFTLSQQGVTRSLVKARAEASKCVVLCANCHAEVEGGVATLSFGSAHPNGSNPG